MTKNRQYPKVLPGITVLPNKTKSYATANENDTQQKHPSGGSHEPRGRGRLWLGKLMLADAADKSIIEMNTPVSMLRANDANVSKTVRNPLQITHNQ